MQRQLRSSPSKTSHITSKRPQLQQKRSISQSPSKKHNLQTQKASSRHVAPHTILSRSSHSHAESLSLAHTQQSNQRNSQYPTYASSAYPTAMAPSEQSLPLASRIGQDQYNFNTLTSIHGTYHPVQSSAEIQLHGLHEADISIEDYKNAVLANQRLQISSEYDPTQDAESRAFSLNSSARAQAAIMNKYRSLKAKYRDEVLNNVTNAYHETIDESRPFEELNLVHLINFLRSANQGRGDVSLYNVQHLSNLQTYMMFVTCRDPRHLQHTSDALMALLASKGIVAPSHHQHNNSSMINKAKHSLHDNNNDDDDLFGSSPVLTVFTSERHATWKLIDLGDVLLHLSYGPERRISKMEDLLRPTEFDLDSNSPELYDFLSSVSLTRCLEIAPFYAPPDDVSDTGM